MSESQPCPQCGGQLTLLAKGADDAPWVCGNCHLGFWNAELSNEARDQWRPSHKDFGRGPHVARIRAARDTERGKR